MKTGSEILLDTLVARGVTTLFGYPGGANMPLYDALLDKQDLLAHYRFAHEQGAVHAADGYARATGNPGICLVTSGPGATNTITGIATAHMDSVPLVVFSGQVPTPLLGKDSFQEVDMPAICEPITKKTYQVTDVNKLAQTIHEALDTAMSGRKGPVLIDLPKDVQLAAASPAAPHEPRRRTLPDPDPSRIAELLGRLAVSERPLIYAGGGVAQARAHRPLLRLAERMDIPVVNTLMGLGTFPRRHPLSLGLAGMHGHQEVNEAIMRCDLLLVVGARFSDRAIGTPATYAPQAFIAHLDIDETEFEKNLSCDLCLRGDLHRFLEELADRAPQASHTPWRAWIAGKVARKAPLNRYCPENIYRIISEHFPADTVVATDTGQHQMWAAQYWPFSSPGQWLTSGGMGTMGYGLGAAIGAAVGNPEKAVVLITGDGSFRMNAQEMLTLAAYELPVTLLLMNNRSLGMVRQLQSHFHESRYTEIDTTGGMDYQKLCEAYGIPSLKAASLFGLEVAIETRKAVQGPFLIEITIDPDEAVYPFVPPGKSLDDYLVSPPTRKASGE